MNLDQLIEFAKACHDNSVDKGWWHDDDGNLIEVTPELIASKIALVHAEISEALEEVRKGEECYKMYLVDGKPEGMVVEFADAVIRILELTRRMGLSHEFAQAMLTKHNYNTTRPFKHGGKKL